MHELCHSHSNISECAIHVLKGLAMGFFGFTIPMSIRSRRFSGQRKGAALASLFGTFRAMDCLLWRIRNKLEDDGKGKTPLALILKKYPTGIAGGASVIPVMLIDKPSILNSTMVLWLVVRALRSLVPSVPYGAVIVMALSAGQILSTWVAAPEELSLSYVKFLYVQGGKPSALVKAVPSQQLMCNLVHPGTNCYQHAAVFFLHGLKRALPVYIPIHLLALCFSRRKNLLITLLNLARSCAFLSAYCMLAWFSACLMFRVSPGVTRTKLLLCTSVSGLATLFEREGRQKELAAYCLTHALDSIYGHLKKRQLVVPKDWVSSMAVVAAFATIMQHHHHQPEFITRMLFGIGMKT